MLMHCFATIHQSQLVGLGDKNKTPTTNPGVALEYNTGPGLVQIHDNTSSSGVYQAQSGSMIPMFVNVFNQWSGAGCTFVRCAVGGTAILAANQPDPNKNWSDTGNLFGQSVTRIQAMLAAVVAAGHTVASFSIISSGGYADAKAGNALNTYGAENSALLTRYRTALSRPTMKIYQELMYAPIGSDSQQTRDNCLIIRDQQLASVASTPGLEIGFTDSTNYTTAWLNADRLHYNQTGLNNMGRLFAEYIAADMGFADPGAVPPSPASRTSQVGRHLVFARPKPPLPRDFGLGTTRWKVPIFTTAVSIAGVGPGGKGGNGVVGLKGGAAGGGAYSKLNTLAVTPGQEYDVTVTAGGTEAPCTVTRVSDSVVIWRAAAGKNGINGNPNGDGAGGLAADCIGDVKTSGQNGGVSGIDNGGNGAAPLGGAGGIGPGPVAGAFPGGGGAAALAGGSALGGAGGTGLVRITAV